MRARTWIVCFTALTASFAAAAPASADPPSQPRETYVTNSTVSAIAKSGNDLYIGGSFSRVGPRTGGFAPVDDNAGDLITGSFPEVAGTVTTSVSDGDGGWFIGGQFTHVDGIARSKLAHIRADGTLDPDWNPGADGFAVSDLLRIGSTLYVAGDFDTISGASRNGLAALETGDGDETNWNPNPTGSSSSASHLDTANSTIYVVGSFTSIGGQSRNGIAALDPTTGDASSWNPNPTFSSSIFWSDLVISGQNAYVVGGFSNIGGQARARLAAVDLTTGNATAFNPAGGTQQVNSLAVSGSTVYVTGTFTSIGGQNRSRLAALNASDGTATSWDPNPNATFSLSNVEVNGSTVYVSGGFTTIGGASRAGTAAVSASTGLATSWDPRPTGGVNSFSFSGSDVYLGGGFASVNSVGRNGIAKLNATTGEAASWNPNATGGSVTALEATASTVYAGGTFTNIGGQARNGIAAIEASSGNATSWNPNPSGATFGQAPARVIKASGSTVYVAGSFTTIGTQSRAGLAALDASTGNATTWNPAPDSTVIDVEVLDQTVLVSGSFTNIGGVGRPRIAQLSPTTGVPTSWNANVSGGVGRLAVDETESIVYAMGASGTFSGQSRADFVALDLATGLPTPWDPEIHGSCCANDIAVAGDDVIIVGEFQDLNGVARSNLGAVDAESGNTRAWNPGADSSGFGAAAYADGDAVYVGGGHRTIANLPQAGIAAFVRADPTLSTNATNATIGSPITDTATLAGGASPTGTITFRAYGPGDANCTGTAAFSASIGVAGNRDYGSGNFTPSQAGTYRWTADYSGDGNNAAASSACNAANETSTVAKASPALATTATNATVGSPISDSGALSGGHSPTGTITFRVYGPNDADCTGTAAYSNAVSVSGNGSYDSGNFTPSQTGAYRWTASYSGDANNETASSACNAANETSTVAKASPSLAMSATSGNAGQPIADTATLTGGQGPGGPTGTLTFRAYGPDDATCTGATAYSNAVNLNAGNGNYGSGNFTPNRAGAYRWRVEYSGDSNNDAVTSACNAANSTSTVAKATPAFATSATSNAIGGPISDHAALFGGQGPSGPTGTITFEAYGPGDADCSGDVAYDQDVTVGSGNGVYSSSNFTPSSAGDYRWTATYSGDANNESVSVACNAANSTSIVDLLTPDLALDSTDAVIDDPISSTAAISGGHSPSGTITFEAYGPDDADCAGPVAFDDEVDVDSGNGDYDSGEFTPAATGDYRWTASYSGDANNEAVATACNDAGSTSTVTPKTIPGLAMTAAQNGTAGGSVSASAALSGGSSPTGAITFRAYGPDDADCSEAPALESTRNVDSGNATYGSGNQSVSLAGAYSWRAFYSGDDANDDVATACGASNSTSTVAKASPTMTASGGPGATLGQPITASGDLAAGVGPTGSITFRAYGPGDATCANSPAVEATVNVNAGNGSYPSGDLTPDRAGTYRWRAFYSGDANNEAAASSCNAAAATTNVAKASPSVANDATDGAVGGAIADEATLSGGLGPSGPTGNLTFRAYGPGDAGCSNSPAFTATVPVDSGNDDYGSGDFTTDAAGTYRWRIEYSGDANNEAITSACNASSSISSVAKAAPSLVTSATSSVTVGQSIADTATLSDGHEPTGTITFRVYGPGDATCSGTPAQTLTADVDSGNDDYGSGNFATTQAGTYRWTAEYSGDSNNEAASSACNAPNETSTAAKAAPTLATNASNGVHGGTIADSATLGGGHSPTGTITFRAYGPGDADCTGTEAFEATVNVNSGNGAYGSGNFSPDEPGTYRWTADYSGDANNDPASSACNAPNETSTVDAPLTVSKAGNGQGGVAADSGSLDCGPDCSHDYAADAVVTLTATPDSNSDFGGFSANCTPTPGTPEECTVTMDAAKTVTATFTSKQRTLDVNTSGPGAGTVSSAPGDIECGTVCSDDYAHNAVVTLTANAAANSDFDGWSANCAPAPGEPEECTVTMDAAKTVTASFRLKQRQLQVLRFGSGSGTVSSSPGGIDCGGDCAENYADGTAVTLTATPADGSELAGFSGNCEVDADDPSSCRTTMGEAKSIAVAFVEAPEVELPGDRDATAPDTAITVKPGGEGRRNSRFRYASSEPEGASFECKLDGDGWESCDPGGVNYRNLAYGNHTFQVTAIDAAGNADPTPAKARFKLRKPRGRR